MFRASKKKRSRPNRIRLTEDEDDEPDEQPPESMGIQTKKMTRKANRFTVRSFQVDEEEEENHKKKKRKKGMGYGGGLILNNNDKEVDDEDEKGHSASLYDKEAISRLKAEQAFKKAEPVQEESHLDLKQSNRPVETFIPLDGKASEEPTILTGEEAMKLSRPKSKFDDEYTLETVMEDGDTNESMQADESAAWEAEVTRRAGLAHTKKSKKTLATTTPSQSLSIEQLKRQVNTTLVQLQEQRDDLERARQRRQTEVIQTQEEYQRQDQELETSGKAVEFYQQLRLKLALWVGALRELTIKVAPIEEALHELETDVAASQRWQDWEDDTISTLHEADLLEQVLGRQPAASIFEKITTVDEFGRDVKSHYVMQREKRNTHRRQVREQRKQRHEDVRGDESDAYLSDQEQENFRERHMALHKALNIAIRDLDDEYTELHKLFEVFQEWHKLYAEDYQQCFASLSLADMASVLIRVELCSLNDPYNESESYNEAKWTTIVHNASEELVLDNEGVERVVEKAVLPALSDLLDKSGYNLVSTKQTQTLSSFYKLVARVLPTESPMWVKLRDQLTAYIRARLDEMAIPIVRKTITEPPPDREDMKEAVYAAKVGHMHRLKKVILNVVKYWGPLLEENDYFIDCILDFASSKFLVLLSSLHDYEQPKFAETPADVFLSIWEVLKQNDWLERPEFAVQSAPLRAATSIYKIS